jgi:hypothetical protein
MVNSVGVWIPEIDYSIYPKEKWCDMDYVANYIREQNYEPKTDIENLVTMLILHFENDAGDYFSWHTDDLMIDIEGLAEFVEISGGLKEFDYYC